MNEPELISGCVQGSRKAQQFLYQKYRGLLFAICCRYTKDKDEAKDIFQEAFIKIFENISNYRQQGSFEGWLKRITVNTALNYYRKNSKSVTSRIDESFEVEQDEPAEISWIASIPEAVLLKSISDLPEELRVVFNLSAIENYSHKEIADLLQIKEDTSRTRLLRARRRLMEQLSKLYKHQVNQ
ncbi:MAG: RNA polymerase sigma factor [Cytophagaceae bacterium]|jgi:RNA polymerase sigma-70 factor (ECF subfamily)|nr:RNA polymerase sigma factor [Cytophagaceae bacterium]